MLKLLYFYLFFWKRVKVLHVEDMDVVVEPGIGWMELNEYLEPYGLFFPLDPGHFTYQHLVSVLCTIINAGTYGASLFD